MIFLYSNGQVILIRSEECIVFLWGVTKYINYVLKKNSVEGYCAKIQNGICIYLC